MSLISGILLLGLSFGQVDQRPDRGVFTFRNIALYPISTGLSNRPADIITLDEGVKQGTIVITESGSAPELRRTRPTGGAFGGRGFGGGQFADSGIGGRRQVVGQSAGAQVNTLWLTNTSGKTLLLVAGEMLLGGQQDRIVQKDGLIPPTKAPVDLAVFCVEHGRWTAQTTQFGTTFAPAAGISGGMGGAGGFAAPGGGRSAAVTTKSQSQVWDSVAQQNRKLGTETSTGTYRENYVSPKTRPMLDEYVWALMGRFPVQNSAGVVVAINGKLIWMDRFDSRETFAKYWPKLLKSYVLEAMSEDRGMGRPTVIPSYREAMHYANSREGKASFEGEEGLSKLTKVETDTTILLELEDLQTTPGIVVHANKVTKR